jgi:hypothetical protein
MREQIKKLTAITLLFSFFSCNACFASSYAQIYSQDLQRQLEAILKGQKLTSQKSAKPQKYGVLKKDTDLAIELSDGISSEVAQQGEVVQTRLVLPIEIDGEIIAPEGSEVSGKILKLKRSGMWYNNAVAEVEFQQIDCGSGYKLPISAKIKTKDNSGLLTGAGAGDTFAKVFSTLAVTTVGGTLAGFGIGLLTPYALIGAAIGGTTGLITGTICLFFKKGKPVDLPAGTKLIITLQNDISVSGCGI